MLLRLDYGRTGLDVELPDENLAAVLRLNPVPTLSDLSDTVRRSLANPIGTRPLADLACSRRNACIVVCDITRPVPNPILLPPIIEELAQGGIPRDRITILIATGTHRPNTGSELIEMLGPECASTCRIVNHSCTDQTSHRFLGTSPNGVPGFLDKTYCDAALKITVGLIEPHFMAGYSGGRKIVMPGIASLETVQAWHSPRFLEHPNATSGVTDGNPVHEESLAIARMIPPDLIVDVTLDEQNRITGVFAGELESAWRTGVALAEKCARVPIPEPADIVVTTSAGYPLDATFYQAVKGMVGALPAVKLGGSIVIAAECSEGVGSDVFKRTLLETDDLQAFVREMQRPDWQFIPDQWEVEELAKATRHAEIHCVSDGIPREALGKLFVEPALTVEDGIQAAMTRHGSGARIAVIPRGPYVIPFASCGAPHDSLAGHLRFGEQSSSRLKHPPLNT